MEYTIKTLGHASLLLIDDNNSPLLLTDPWLIGSAYWRSWWLQNYPDPSLIDTVAHTKYVYITHEHPDHLHLPSIRKIGKQSNYLCPDLPHIEMPSFMKGEGLDVQILPTCQWLSLNQDISICSIALWNDDSILLIKTPKALIININDAKPNRFIVSQLRKIVRSLSGEKVILLSSYSPASIVNSFFRSDKREHLRQKSSYVKYINSLCDQIKVDLFVPFASQVIFMRNDSRWANDYKVSYYDLQEHWNSKSLLLHPYSTINLETFEITHIPEESYNSGSETKNNTIAKREKDEREASFEVDDVMALAKKFQSSRFISMILFPKGIGFEIGDQYLIFNPWNGKIVDCNKKRLDECNFWYKLPPQSLKEALAYGHLGDLFISMTVDIHLNGRTNAKVVYALFIFFTLDDAHHFESFEKFKQWIMTTVKSTFLSSPKLSLPE
jgi:Beta-lactamase superfamily domain